MVASPQVQKGALVRIDDPDAPKSGDAFVFQFNPESLERGIEQSPDGPPAEVISFTLPLDAADAMAAPGSNEAIDEHGLYPALNALEMLMYPQAGGVPSWVERFFGIGAAAQRRPLALFIWGEHRAVPGQVTHLEISEDQFDPTLKPIRATVRVRLQVVNGDHPPGGAKIRKIWQRHLGIKRDVAKLGYTTLP